MFVVSFATLKVRNCTIYASRKRCRAPTATTASATTTATSTVASLDEVATAEGLIVALSVFAAVCLPSIKCEKSKN